MWDKCSKFDRGFSEMSGMPKRLKTIDVLPLCELQGYSINDLENILLIESVAYPFIFKSAKKQQEKNK